MGGPYKFGDELKNIRETKKLTLREVEELSGVSNAYLSQLENNKIKKPSANTLYKLAIAYGIDFDLLLERAGIIERQVEERTSKSISSYALYSEDLTTAEENELLKYLKYLRFNKSYDKK